VRKNAENEIIRKKRKMRKCSSGFHLGKIEKPEYWSKALQYERMRKMRRPCHDLLSIKMKHDLANKLGLPPYFLHFIPINVNYTDLFMIDGMC
jgi:hypothetical protein